MKVRLLLISILFFFFLPAIRAQVTMGGASEPRKGALLDLKENGNTAKEANSDKGLGLPRVALSGLTTLTVDADSKGNEYVGLTVYNVTGSAAIAEGIYCWLGTRWKQLIVVDGKGNKGNILKSNGDGTYGWSTVTIPEYTYHKPTQISIFDAGKKKDLTYSYTDLVSIQSGSDAYIYKPKANVFDNAFVYTDVLSVKTDAPSEKYMLLGMTINVKKNTVNDKVAKTGFWENMKVEVLIGDGPAKKTYERIYSTPSNGNPTTFIDLFSVIPLSELGKGDYELKIRISNTENRYRLNAGTGEGQFNPSQYNTGFYFIELRDFGLVLYEVQ